MENPIKIGIIGGSGLYEMDGLTGVEKCAVATPFGEPSDAYITGVLEGVRVAFLPRHGRGHRLLPSEVNFQANIFGFKKLGVEFLISVTAVGSLRETIHPLDLVIPDQFFDRTHRRISTFFGNGLAAHIAFADPVCPELGRRLYEAATAQHFSVHNGGTLVCIEGPAFSTRAESEYYRRAGMDIIGMTSLQEAKLAREAEICYAPLAIVTDYDCWHTEETAVSVETVVANLKTNVNTAGAVIRHLVSRIPGAGEKSCECASALKNAIMTDRHLIPEEARKRLAPIVGKYLDPTGSGVKRPG